MTHQYDKALSVAGMSIGICNDDANSGTWEWFDRKNNEYKAGFDSAYSAYVDAADYAKNELYILLPSVDEDGDLIL